MVERKKIRIEVAIGAIAIVIGLLVLCIFQDMNISNALYNPKSIVGIAFESFGFWPAYVAVPIMGAAWYWGPGIKEKKIIGLAFLFVGFIGIWYKTMDELTESNTIAKKSYLLIVVLGVAFALLTFFVMKQFHRATVARIAFVGEVGFAYMLLYNLTAGAIKILWGRWRYFEMLEIGNFENYSPWYAPQGITGHTSFPSGHTLAACGVFLILVYVYVKNKSKASKILTAIGCSAYVVCMSISRIVMGRHFASDTIAAMAIAAIAFAIILYSKRYHKWFYYCKANQSREGLKFTG